MGKVKTRVCLHTEIICLTAEKVGVQILYIYTREEQTEKEHVILFERCHLGCIFTSWILAQEIILCPLFFSFYLSFPLLVFLVKRIQMKKKSLFSSLNIFPVQL